MKQNGFTLIELTIVVALIGILASIAIPTYQKYSQNASDKACLAETKSYTTIIFGALVDPNNSMEPVPPNYNACTLITDASSWSGVDDEHHIIEGTIRNGAHSSVICDLLRGATCTFR